MPLSDVDRLLEEGEKSKDLTGWRVEPIPSDLAVEMVIEHHYLHRRGPCEAAFGLIPPEGDVRGVVAYGTPASAPLRKGIAGQHRAGDVIELTRCRTRSIEVVDKLSKIG